MFTYFALTIRFARPLYLTNILVCKNCLHVTPGLALEDSRLATLGEEVEVLISFHQYDQYIMYHVLGYIQRISKDSSCIGVLVNGEGPGEAVDSVGEGFGGGGYCVLANSRYFGTG